MMIGDVKRMAAIFFGISRQQIESPSRLREHTRPRQIAMTMCRKYTRGSLPQIGRAFGGRDHTTVIHAMKAVDALVKESQEDARDIAMLCAQIEAGAISVQSVWMQSWHRKMHRRGNLTPDDIAADQERTGHSAYIDALKGANVNFAVRTPSEPTPAVRHLSGPRVLLLRGPDSFPCRAA